MPERHIRNEGAHHRRRQRVRADLGVVVVFRDGDKRPARVIDLSVGGAHLEADRVPEYGEMVTVVVRLHESDDWHLLAGAVRWVGRRNFGVAFGELDARQSMALAAFIGHAA